MRRHGLSHIPNAMVYQGEKDENRWIGLEVDALDLPASSHLKSPQLLDTIGLVSSSGTRNKKNLNPAL